MGLPGINGNEHPARLPVSGAQISRPQPENIGSVEGAAGSRAKPGETLEDAERTTSAVVFEPPARRAGMRLRIDETSKRIIAQIVDEHNKVIKQVPPEEMLKVMARIRRLQGLFLDTRV